VICKHQPENECLILVLQESDFTEECSRGLFALTCRINHACAGASNARSYN